MVQINEKTVFSWGVLAVVVSCVWGASNFASRVSAVERAQAVADERFRILQDIRVEMAEIKTVIKQIEKTIK